jgi:hypothetical protein
MSLNLLQSVQQSVEQVTNTTAYYGFKVEVFSLELGSSVTLRVSIAFLVNGTLDKSQPNDGTYNYTNRFITLSGTDYTNWGSDDSYISTYVSNHFDSVLASNLKPRPGLLGGGRGRGLGLGI